MTNKLTEAAIEEAAKLPTAKDVLDKHATDRGSITIGNFTCVSVSYERALDAIESHTAAHTAALRKRVKELENELKLSEDTIKHQAERCLKLESDNSRVLNEVKEINQLAKKTRANVTLRIVELETENTRLREALERAYNDFKSSRWTEETYKTVIEALKNNER